MTNMTPTEQFELLLFNAGLASRDLTTPEFEQDVVKIITEAVAAQKEKDALVAHGYGNVTGQLIAKAIRGSK